ncbi:hypothetical protein B0T21DRAFT_447626 [Apiosordaria backusii]|uniref:Uncharacterized protein n=1 Tax=Apiosordaria backusii TaxID=314023 RepID=A0AA40ERW8_9PEZI|nr:hypothetical protein B0T21DRAFT_447626 [Apiosordaria backusii]
MLGPVILKLAALGMGALASGCEPYSEVPIWGSIESSTMSSTTLSSPTTKSYSVVPINTWTPDHTPTFNSEATWGLGAQSTLETRIAARATDTSLTGVIGSHVSDRDTDDTFASDATPIQSGPGDCNDKKRQFNCISPGDEWQECSSGKWSTTIPIGNLGGVATKCLNDGVHPFLKLSYLPGSSVDTPVMTGPCIPDAKRSVSNTKRDTAAGLYNCIWPGFEFQTCSDTNTWTNPAPMMGGIHCNSWGVEDYLSTDEVPVF